MRLTQDAAAGAVFVAMGLAGLWFGREYDVGSARTMGPGYLPTLLCYGLIGLGALIAVRGLVRDGELVGRWRLRPFVFILAAVAVFALAIEPAGLAPTVFLATLLAAFARDNVRIAETLALALLLSAGAVAIFVYGLALPLRAFPI